MSIDSTSKCQSAINIQHQILDVGIFISYYTTASSHIKTIRMFSDSAFHMGPFY